MPARAIRLIAVGCVAAVLRSQLEACETANQGDPCSYDDNSGVCSPRLDGSGLACISNLGQIVGDVNCQRGIRSNSLCCPPDCEVCGGKACTSDVPKQCCETNRSCSEFYPPCIFIDISTTTTEDGPAEDGIASDFLSWFVIDGWWILIVVVALLACMGCCCIAVWWRRQRKRKQSRRFVAKARKRPGHAPPITAPDRRMPTAKDAKVRAAPKSVATHLPTRGPTRAPDPDTSSSSTPVWKMPTAEETPCDASDAASIAFSHGLYSSSESDKGATVKSAQKRQVGQRPQTQNDKYIPSSAALSATSPLKDTTVVSKSAAKVPPPARGKPKAAAGSNVVPENAPSRKSVPQRQTAAKGMKAKACITKSHWSSMPWKGPPQKESDPESEPSSAAPSEVPISNLRRYVANISNAGSSVAATSEASGDELDDDFFGRRGEVCN